MNTGLTASPEEDEVSKDSLTFLRLMFLVEGDSPVSKKVNAIHDALPSTSVGQVKSFMGMVTTYCAKFVTNFSNAT